MTDIVNGNMADVYRIALAKADRTATRRGPYAAEITPGCRALWHLVRTMPSSETATARRLVERKFGIYLPTFGRDNVLPKTGRVRAGAPLFPGYLFLFVWGLDQHWRRVRDCPGVAEVIVIDERPVIVPDRVIDEIQVLELVNGNIDDPCRKAVRGWRKRVLGRMLRERGRELATISTPSRFAGLDDIGRISALHTALGLASGAPA